MKVYNISFQIDPALEIQWLEWMKNNFIPTLMSGQSLSLIHISEPTRPY